MAESRKPRILIADDEAHSRAFLRAMLNTMNCEVVGEAQTGAQAVDLFKQLKPHLMLLDINMPVKTGDEVLAEVFKEFPDAFVIMLTSVVDMASVEKYLSLGAANYIRKDTPLEEIKQIIKETWMSFLQSKRLKQTG